MFPQGGAPTRLLVRRWRLLHSNTRSADCTAALGRRSGRRPTGGSGIDPGAAWMRDESIPGNGVADFDRD